MYPIIRAQVSDLYELLAFAEHCFRVAYQDDNEAATFEEYCRIAFAPETFLREMEHPGSEFWLMQMEGKTVGYLKLNFDRHHADLRSNATMQLERIYIDPKMQSRGLGARLLEFAHGRAQAARAVWMWLSVWQMNPRAVKMYERCGFEIFGTDIFYLGGDPQVDWAMKKRV